MRYCVLLLSALSLVPAVQGQEKVGRLLAKIKAVGKEGKGNPEAAAAWKELVKQDAAQLTDVIGGLDDAAPISANWIRAAVDAIAEKTLAAGKRLPADRLEAL